MPLARPLALKRPVALKPDPPAMDQLTAVLVMGETVLANC